MNGRGNVWILKQRIGSSLNAQRMEMTMGMCRACYGQGFWEAECCNGSGGCSCGGQPVSMGTCNVCGGSGEEPENPDYSANARAIQGYGFLGSGPTGGYFGVPAMGRPGRR